MNENERIEILRKELNLTLEKFGEIIGITGGAVGNIEKGRRALTEQVIKAVTREFNVNEEWLRTGKGDMFIEDSDSLIAKIVSEIPLDNLSQSILKTYIELDPKKREAFNQFIRELANDINDSFPHIGPETK